MAIIPQSFYETHLTSAISASASTIPVAKCPAAGVTSGFITIGSEIIKFEGNSNPGGAGNLTSCTRGLALSGVTETTAGLGAAHAAGQSVKIADVHYYLNNANAVQTISTTGTPEANDYAKFNSVNVLEGRSYSEVITDLGLTRGIANDNLVEIDSTTITNAEYAKFTANGLESKSYAEVKTDLSLNNVENTALSTWAGSGNVTTVGTLASGNATAIVSAASDSAAGKVELATIAETTTGTDTGRAITPDGLAGSSYGKRIVQIKLVDDATALATGDGKLYFVIPSELNGYNLVDADAAVSTVSSSGTPTYRINLTQTADMLSTKITIDANENTSYTAATAPVIDGNNDDVATGDILRIDKDVAGTGEKGDIIVLSFQLP